MEECYLHADGKGIFPHDLEDRAEYLIRAMKMQEIYDDPRFKRSILSNLLADYPGQLVKECTAPYKAYDIMASKFGCDVSCTPYFKVGKTKFLEDSMGSCGLKHWRIYGENDIIVPYVLITCCVFEQSTAVHEFIHAVRAEVIDKPYAKKDKVLAELFAEANALVPLHNVFLEYPIHSIRKYSQMAKAHWRLRKAFGDKADYAFIRLKEDELDDINSIDNDKVKEYFKRRTAYLEREDLISTAGKLRFQIMCERMGL